MGSKIVSIISEEVSLQGLVNSAYKVAVSKKIKNPVSFIYNMCKKAEVYNGKTKGEFKERLKKKLAPIMGEKEANAFVAKLK